MLLENGNGTFTGGQADVLCMLKNVNNGRFYAAFFEENPMPGEIKPIK